VQILSITANNASSNDTMIDHLEDLLEDFPGDANQTRCFLHVVALIAGTLKKQFDLPKKGSVDLDKELTTLAKNIEEEEADTRNCLELDEDDDDMEGWVDELENMSIEERAEHEKSVRPLRLLLAKARHFFHHLQAMLTCVQL
jgi:hypothetical protein